LSTDAMVICAELEDVHWESKSLGISSICVALGNKPTLLPDFVLTNIQDFLEIWPGFRDDGKLVRDLYYNVIAYGHAYVKLPFVSGSCDCSLIFLAVKMQEGIRVESTVQLVWLGEYHLVRNCVRQSVQWKTERGLFDALCEAKTILKSLRENGLCCCFGVPKSQWQLTVPNMPGGHCVRCAFQFLLQNGTVHRGADIILDRLWEISRPKMDVLFEFIYNEMNQKMPTLKMLISGDCVKHLMSLRITRLLSQLHEQNITTIYFHATRIGLSRLVDTAHQWHQAIHIVFTNSGWNHQLRVLQPESSSFY
jgi:hypothetical protein